MKKLIKKIMLIATAFGMFFTLNTNAYAYSYPEYDENDMGYIIKENYPESESKVILYMYVDSSDRDIMYTKSWYRFRCTSQAYTEFAKTTPLVFEYRPENKKVFATLDGGEVWAWQFCIENGDYVFASGEGNYNSTYTLTQNLEFFEKIEDEEHREIVSVENETIRVYAMRGSSEWIENNKDGYIEWVSETEKSFRGIEDSMKPADSTQETISVTQNPEETSSTETTEQTEQETSDKTSVETQTPDIAPTPVEEPEMPEVESNNWSILIKGGAAILVLVLIGFVFVKKKK